MQSKHSKFPISSFLGFGCTTEPQISMQHNTKKTKPRKNKNKKEQQLRDVMMLEDNSVAELSSPCFASQQNSEMLMFQSRLLMSRRLGCLDRYRDLRLDVDSMTYEDLLELGNKIGHVNTGLEEDKIGRCVRTTKLSIVDELSLPSFVPEIDQKCNICQEEYKADDELGKLECGHAYHLDCIKQWLSRKNACPVCKAEASS